MIATQNDLCLGFFDQMWEKGALSFPTGASVLEVGCCEADFLTPLKQARPDLYLVGLDWRSQERPGANSLVQGDVCDPALFPAETFDAIVSISAIEHVGLGAYGDPIAEEGDSLAMQNLRRWVKPHGWVYLDVPYRPHGPYTVTKNFRAYDEAAVQARLLPGFIELARGVFEAHHPDSPYLALVLSPA